VQRHFELNTVNIQEPGQESWKKKYVYWIPALHLDGKEIAKGRWDDHTVLRALDEWNQLQQETHPEKLQS
jgi:zinc finger CCHC domain-containing protein 8